MKMIMLSLVVEKIDLSKTKCAKFSPQLVLSLVIGIPLLFGLSAVLGFWKGQRLRGLISFTRRAFFSGVMELPDRQSLQNHSQCGPVVVLWY